MSDTSELTSQSCILEENTSFTKTSVRGEVCWDIRDSSNSARLIASSRNNGNTDINVSNISKDSLVATPDKSEVGAGAKMKTIARNRGLRRGRSAFTQQCIDMLNSPNSSSNNDNSTLLVNKKRCNGFSKLRKAKKSCNSKNTFENVLTTSVVSSDDSVLNELMNTQKSSAFVNVARRSGKRKSSHSAFLNALNDSTDKSGVVLSQESSVQEQGSDELLTRTRRPTRTTVFSKRRLTDQANTDNVNCFIDALNSSTDDEINLGAEPLAVNKSQTNFNNDVNKNDRISSDKSLIDEEKGVIDGEVSNVTNLSIRNISNIHNDECNTGSNKVDSTRVPKSAEKSHPAIIVTVDPVLHDGGTRDKSVSHCDSIETMSRVAVEDSMLISIDASDMSFRKHVQSLSISGNISNNLPVELNQLNTLSQVQVHFDNQYDSMEIGSDESDNCSPDASKRSKRNKCDSNGSHFINVRDFQNNDSAAHEIKADVIGSCTGAGHKNESKGNSRRSLNKRNLNDSNSSHSLNNAATVGKSQNSVSFVNELEVVSGDSNTDTSDKNKNEGNAQKSLRRNKSNSSHSSSNVASLEDSGNNDSSVSEIEPDGGDSITGASHENERNPKRLLRKRNSSDSNSCHSLNNVAKVGNFENRDSPVVGNNNLDISNSNKSESYSHRSLRNLNVNNSITSRSLNNISNVIDLSTSEIAPVGGGNPDASDRNSQRSLRKQITNKSNSIRSLNNITNVWDSQNNVLSASEISTNKSINNSRRKRQPIRRKSICDSKSSTVKSKNETPSSLCESQFDLAELQFSEIHKKCNEIHLEQDCEMVLKQFTFQKNKASIVDNVIESTDITKEIVTLSKSKPPKLKKPAKWVSKHLYKFVTNKLEPKYGLQARARAEKFILYLADIVENVTVIPRTANDYERNMCKVLVESLIMEMARLKLIVHYWDFYRFVDTFLPYTFSLRSVPRITPFGQEPFVSRPPGRLFDSIL